jgi:hypothetical protein
MKLGTNGMGARTWWGLAGLVVGVATVSRVPGLLRPWMERDEAHIAVQAQTLLRGGQLYVDVIDRKPPLVPAIYAAVAWLSGSSDLRFVRVLLVLWVAATALVVAAIVRRLHCSWRATMVAALLYVLGTAAFLPRDGQGANFELWAALPATGAILLALARPDSARRAWLLTAAGALVGIAACMKQPFLITMAPVGIAAFGKGRWGGVLAATAGALGAIVVVGGTFGLEGMLRWAWTENDGYFSGAVLEGRVLAVAVLMTLLFVAGHAPAMWLGVRARFHHDRREVVIVVVWLAASALAVVAGFRFLGHYYQQLVAPLCVLAGVGVDRVSRRTLTAHLGVAGVAATVAVVIASAFGPQPMEMTQLRAVIEAHTEEGEPILVWGDAPEIYLKTERSVAGAFVQSTFLTSMGSGRAAVRARLPEEAAERRWEVFLADLRAEPPQVVVDMSSRRRGFEYRPEEVPLGDFLRSHYEFVDTIRGMEVWVHESRA